jgi:hypothetical protein
MVEQPLTARLANEDVLLDRRGVQFGQPVQRV